MDFGDRSDAELIELARAGWAPALAVLVHRYAPLVHAAVAPATRDPRTAVVEVFTSAMREIWYRHPASPVAPWLLGLAGARRAPANPPPLRAGEIDAIWIQLHRRWPTGRPVRWHLPWQRVGTVAGLIALAAVVPAVVLGTDEASDDELTEVRAVPLDEEPVEEEPAAEPAEAQEDLTFPTASEEEPASDPPPPDSDDGGAGADAGEERDGEAGDVDTGSEPEGEPEGEPDDPPDEPDDGDDEPDPEEPDDGLIGELVGGDGGTDDGTEDEGASDETAADDGTADEGAPDDGSGTG